MTMRPPLQWLQPAFHPAYARLLCTMIRVRGGDVTQLLAGTGLSWEALMEDNRGISFVRIRQIIRAAQQVSQTPALGLVLGSATQAAAHGAPGYAALAARDVAQALALLSSYARLRTSALELRLLAFDERDAFCRIQLRELFDLGDVRMFILEATLVVIVRLLEAMLGQRLPQLEYCLPWPAPAWAGEYAAHLDGRCRFDAAGLEIRLPAALLHAPCLTFDAAALTSARKDCEVALAQLARADDITHQVRLRFLDCEGDYPDCPAMAARLNMSVRTLVRKLAKQGSSYQMLLDEARKESAQWYLQHTDYPVERIAERLGYRDTSNFSRCFRRWFGVTPKQMRDGSYANSTSNATTLRSLRENSTPII